MAGNLLPDQSNLEDIKTKIPFDLLLFKHSDIEDQEKVNLVKIFVPLNYKLTLAKGSPNKKMKQQIFNPNS